MRQFWQKFSEKLSFVLKFMKPFYKYLAVVQLLLGRRKKKSNVISQISGELKSAFWT